MWSARSGLPYIIVLTSVKPLCLTKRIMSGKISYLHKVLSPVVDYSLDMNCYSSNTIGGSSKPSQAPSTQVVVPTRPFNRSRSQQPSGIGSTCIFWMLSGSTTFHCFSSLSVHTSDFFRGPGLSRTYGRSRHGAHRPSCLGDIAYHARLGTRR